MSMTWPINLEKPISNEWLEKSDNRWCASIDRFKQCSIEEPFVGDEMIRFTQEIITGKLFSGPDAAWCFCNSAHSNESHSLLTRGLGFSLPVDS